MSTLDELNTPPDPNEVTPIKTGLTYGIILVVVGIAFQLLTNAIGLSGNFMVGTISLIIPIAVIVFAIRYHRDKELGGFISLRRGWAVTFWMGISYGIFVGFWVWFNNNVLASDEANALQQRELDKIRAQVEDGELPQEMLGMMEWFIEVLANPIFMMTMALLSILFIGFFVSLFTKRERPLI